MSMRAFSLVELSIVLVILGLLTGGILAGQSLIRASELRAVTQEMNRYSAAVHAFRDKYFLLPGDMNNATKFWGIAAGTGSDATCYNTVQTGTATCDGNANGQVSRNDGPVAGGEYYLFWKHLTNAGLIEGSYSGTTATNGGYTSPYTSGIITAMPGWNIPSSKLSNATWMIANMGTENCSIQKFYGAYPADATSYYINTLYLLSKSLNPITGAGGGVTPSEAWNIDIKMDDGSPSKGKMEAFRGGSNVAAGPCLTDADPALAQYNLSSSSGSCSLVFLRTF